MFEPAVDYTLENEGGYGWNALDEGGPTNWGITMSDLAEFVGHQVSVADVQNMTVDTAKQIYLAKYWSPLALGQVTDQGIATCIFDSGVLYGTGIGARYGQTAANECGENLVLDGRIGPLTLAAFNRVEPKQFLIAYHARIMSRINSIIAASPSQEIFRDGWTNRANRLLTLA